MYMKDQKEVIAMTPLTVTQRVGMRKKYMALCACECVKERDYKIKDGVIKCQDIVGTVSFCQAL